MILKKWNFLKESYLNSARIANVLKAAIVRSKIDFINTGIL